MQGGAATGSKQDVARNDGCSVRLVKNLAGAVRTVGFHRIGRATREGTTTCCIHIHRRHRNCAASRVVSKGAACGAVSDTPPVGVQAEGTRHTAELDDVDTRPHREPCGTVRKLIRLLGSVLDCRAVSQDGRTRTIGHQYVVVVAGGAERIAPFQRYVLGGLGERGVVQRTEGLGFTCFTCRSNHCRQRSSAGDKVAFKGSRRPMCQIAGVGGRRQKNGSGSGDRIDRLGDRTILEGTFVEIGVVIHNDVAACHTAQIEDVGRKLRHAGAGRGKDERRTRGHVMDDFQHRRTLIARSRLTGQHRHDCRQVTTGLARRERIHTVRQHTDLDAHTCVPRRMRHVGLVCRHTLPRHAAGIGQGAGLGADFQAALSLLGRGHVAVRGTCFPGADGLHIVAAGDITNGGDRYPGCGGVKQREFGDVITPALPDVPRQFGRDRAFDNDENRLVVRHVLLGEILHTGRQLLQTAGLQLPGGRGTRQFDERRIHLALGSRHASHVFDRALRHGGDRNHACSGE